ncbi:MAG: META domain-containing protein [Methyloprofundus sp.]|nr:META domain-containing protein [Methyloprofundus sp.]
MFKALFLTLILLQGCSSLTSQPTTEGTQTMSQLRLNQQWQLTGYLTPQGMQAPLTKHLASIEFATKKLSGSTGCNQYFASYQQTEPNILQISQAVSTMMACSGEIMQQEQQYLTNLARTRSYNIDNNQLQLLDEQQQTLLTFKLAPTISLQDTYWQMIGINNGKGGVVSSAFTKKAHLLFTNGKLQGKTGCNTLFATYQVDANKLSISAVGSTRMRCPESALMLQEQQITQALAKVDHFEIRNQQLRLLSAQGSLLLSLKQQQQ